MIDNKKYFRYDIGQHLEKECGVLLPGRKADILVADREFRLLSVLKSGRTIKE